MTDHDTPTDPTGFDIPVSLSEPPAQDDAARFAGLVSDSLDVKLAALRKEINASIVEIIVVEAGTRKAVKTLADAFAKHNSDEQKHRAAMLKALAVRSIAPTVALVISLVAIGMVALGPQPAQAQRVCPPGIGGGP